MTDPLIQWIIGQVGLAGVASLALFMLRNVFDERIKEQKLYADTLKAYTDKLLAIVEKKTETEISLINSISSLQQTILNLQRQVERLEQGRYGGPTVQSTR